MVLTFSNTEEHIFNKVMAALRDETASENIYGSPHSILSFSNLEICPREQMVYRDGEIVSMTYHEFFTLLYLAQHPVGCSVKSRYMKMSGKSLVMVEQRL